MPMMVALQLGYSVQELGEKQMGNVLEDDSTVHKKKIFLNR